MNTTMTPTLTPTHHDDRRCEGIVRRYQLTSGQKAEVQKAYAESPAGVERLVLSISQNQRLTSPTGFLLKQIRDGAHLAVHEDRKGLSPLEFAIARYRAKL